jgi:hypothetical protein
MTTRRILFTVAAISTAAALYSYSGYHRPRFLSHNNQTMAAENIEDLSVVLEKVPDAQTAILVKIQNKNPSSSFTFLTWDTPFDPQAMNLGVFKLRDAETGDLVEGVEIRINRMLPPPREALVEVGPGSEVTKKVELDAPWIPKHTSKNYTIEAVGRWHSVWNQSSSSIQEQELETVGGGDALKGEFKSNAIEVSL